METIDSIFNVTAPALDLSYIAVIALRLYYAKEFTIRKGPFHLGKWQKPINYIAIAWVLFIAVVLFFPTASPVTPANMNYAVVVAAFIAFFALSWWFVGARK